MYKEFTDKQSSDALLICQFICAVYTPSYFYVYFNPSVASGPSNMLHVRNLLLDANRFYSFPQPATLQVKKIFINHALTWLDPENVALAVYSNDNTFNKDNVKNISTFKTIAQRKSMLWSKKYTLKAFMTADAITSPLGRFKKSLIPPIFLTTC